MKLRNLCYLVVAFLLCNNLLMAQSNLDKGWAAFYKNNRKEARDYFNKAATESSSGAEAKLALSFIEEVDGKNDAAFKDFQDFFKLSDNPYPYLFALWHSPVIFSYENKKKDNRIELLNAILKDPKANGTLKAMAYSALGKHYMATNNISKAKDEFEKIGTIDKWDLAGEFENISESGFDKNFDPISNPSESATFTNKDGAPVKWFEMKGNRTDNWIDFEYHFYIDNTIIYAQSFVSSPVDQQVQMRIGTSGSLKVWVNDALVYSESKERDNDLDTYITEVKLNKGSNRILLQVGASEIENSNFMLRLTNENGDPIAGLKASAKPEPYTKATAGTNKVIKIFAEDYFENKVKQEPTKIINYLMLASAYLRNDKSYEARKVLLRAEEIAPECSYIRTKLIEAYIRESNETDEKIEREWLKDHDADNIISLNLFYDDEVKKENYEEAQKLVDKMESIYREDAESVLKHLNLLGELKKRDELITAIDKAYKKYPDYYPIVEYKCSVEENVNKNFNACIDVIKRYLKENYTFTAQGKLVEAYFSKGDIPSGLSAYSEQLKHEPYSCGIIYKLASYYYQTRDYTTAEKYYKNALSIAPYINSFWSGLGECYEAMGRKDDAKAAYEKAIEYKPTDYEARKSLRQLQGKSEIFSNFPQPEVYDIIKKAPDASAYPEDNSLILEDQVQKVVYEGGASEEKHIFVVKVFNQQGIDKWKEYYVSYNSMQSYLIEKAEVVKAKGSKVEAETNNSHVVFTTLEAGDAIYITFRLKSFQTGKLAPHFWDDFYFTHYYPSIHSQYSLLISPKVKFKYEFSQKKIEPVTKKVGEFDYYTWDQGKQASIMSEDKMPRLADVADILYLSSFPDWTYISNWYYDLASRKAKSDFEVTELVNTLFKDKTGLTELQKANVIYNYIADNIHYSSVSFLQSGLIPQKASKVINTKIGDCKDVSTLFVALCKEAGLDADWVLVSTRDRGMNQNILPSIEFNHCIAKLNADGKEYYIELTSNSLPFNTFYSKLMNAEALPIASEQSKTTVNLLHLNPGTRNKNLIVRKTDASLTDNDITVKKSNIKTGVLAAGMRDSYRDKGEQEQKKSMQKAVAGDFPNTRLANISFTNLKGTSDTVNYVFDYKATDPLTDLGGMRLLTLPWSEKAESKDFVFGDTRTYPIDLWSWASTDAEEETITLHFPSTFHLSEMPKPVNYTCPIAQYSLTYKSEPGKLTISRHFNYTKDMIDVNQINDFSNFYKKVVAADAKPIAFKQM